MRTRLFALLLTACATAPAPAPEPEKNAEAAPEAKPAPLPMPPGLDEAAMDTSTDPCTDFYQFACGGWMQATQIPDDRPLYSRGFVSITEQNELKLKAIGDDAAAGKLPEGTAFARQLGDYWASCMDEAKLEDGAKDLHALIDALKVGNAKDLANTLAAFHLRKWNAFFDVDSIQDFKKSTELILGLDQSGLGLPDRDYYLKDDEKTKKVRDLYVEHLGAMLKLWGAPADAAKQVMELETRLAKAQLTNVERRNPKNLDHKVDRAGLKKLAPALPWDLYLAGVGMPQQQAINVTSEAYFKELSAVFKETKPAVLQQYLAWVALRTSTLALPAAYQTERFRYESAALTGAKVDRPRWKKCVALADQDLPEVLGREFVRRHFGEEGKRTTQGMVKAVQAAVEKDFDSLSWMDEPTKKAAHEKVQRMAEHNKIGFPDAWRDYSGLSTTRTSFLQNRVAARALESKRRLSRIGKPLDRNEWIMTPSTVNAYNEGQMNEIVFPAGILQPPFFNGAATDAVNFGSMGMVVGHEITHGFDDEGRQFDVDGNLRDWWSEASGKSFVEKADCVKRQYDGYIAIEDIHVKGDLTLGENVADLGGLKLAHAAMEEWLKAKPQTSKYRYSPSQQFFLGFAQSWCTKVRPETARLRAATDPHSPPYWRVNGPMGNLDAFTRAFSCRESAPMIRKGAERCEVW
ncbi:MAG: M13 family metallopeptidase [Archangiaceae bacterium]|nr:M13 family metallopeptidase [Archangiaceae bacterium]